MVEILRTYAHGLAFPAFEDPKKLVSYIGAVQAQDIEMCKWAVGIRLKHSSLSHVREAIDSGEIIRIHIMRPTWHLVAAEDIRWMISLCRERLRMVYMKSWWKHYEIDEKIYSRFYDNSVRLLLGNDGLTIPELTTALNHLGYSWSQDQVKCMIATGEVEGLFCNGREKNRKATYALLDERVPIVPDIPREEALMLLALKYFRSHGPASLKDFMWWSGFSTTEAKTAVIALGNTLITDRYKNEKLLIHESFCGDFSIDDNVYLLPPYDEYLISYTDRSHVLEPKHAAKAHNNFGIFQPVILYKGKIVGNWKKIKKKNSIEIETSFFNKTGTPGKRKVNVAIDYYLNFLKK